LAKPVPRTNSQASSTWIASRRRRLVCIGLAGSCARNRHARRILFG
jgi:hypothetical protein